MAEIVFAEAPPYILSSGEIVKPKNAKTFENFLDEYFGDLISIALYKLTSNYGEETTAGIYSTFISAGIFAVLEGYTSVLEAKPVRDPFTAKAAYKPPTIVIEDSNGRIMLELFKSVHEVLEEYLRGYGDDVDAMYTVMSIKGGDPNRSLPALLLFFTVGVLFATRYPDEVVRVKFYTPDVI